MFRFNYRMDHKHFRDVVLLISKIVGIGLLIFFFWWKFQLALTRYFDADEYAYLHWAYNVSSGKLPYRDFFFYIPPGFLWMLAPLFAFFHGVTAFIAGRVLAFVIFCTLSLVAGLLFWEVRRSWVVLFVPLLLVFLPLPSDKFLEIRPDTLAMLLAMLGLLFQVRGIRDIGGIRGKKIAVWFFSGAFYGLSLLVLPKTLPQVAVAVLVAIGWGICVPRSVQRSWIWLRQRISLRERNLVDKGKSILQFFIGIFIPLGLFGLWSLFLGDIGLVWYSITTLPRVVGQETAKMFPMQPDLFFYPNDTFYGENGWSVGLIINHVVWFIGLTMGAVRLLTPWLGTSGELGKYGRSGAWIEFLIAGSFFAHVIFFFWIYPLRHAQYLIPIAVFVVWYTADFIYLLWYKGVNKFPTGIVFTVLVSGCAGLLWIFIRVNSPKLHWTNKIALANIENIHKTIPFNQYLLDFDGSTLYYKDPYYICCLPFGEFVPFMSRKVSSVIAYLEKTQTRYIYEGDLLRVNTLSPDEKNYIRTHYVPYPNIPGLLERK